MDVAETGMGIVEDKVIKNHYAAEYIYNTYKNAKTCGVIERDEAIFAKGMRWRFAARAAAANIASTCSWE